MLLAPMMEYVIWCYISLVPVSINKMNTFLYYWQNKHNKGVCDRRHKSGRNMFPIFGSYANGFVFFPDILYIFFYKKNRAHTYIFFYFCNQVSISQLTFLFTILLKYVSWVNYVVYMIVHLLNKIHKKILFIFNSLIMFI
jgi:hypothetical protein